MKRPTIERHHGQVENSRNFIEAFKLIKENPSKTYLTASGKAFMAKAKKTTSGQHKGEDVIVFLRNKQESARAYSCCWGKVTNCNRTYIDVYTPFI